MEREGIEYTEVKHRASTRSRRSFVEKANGGQPDGADPAVRRRLHAHTNPSLAQVKAKIGVGV
ncbi:hypothetical protein GCM10020221_35190 [Streptomyces thioluteus]|uniref:Uncharacterized protein n=1 Tax=Streptomyces thioluteus TaxID=66431 RepID=A0ABN3X3F8_STRTU